MENNETPLPGIGNLIGKCNNENLWSVRFMTRKTKAVRFVSRMLAAIMAIMTIMACQQGLVISAFADSELPLTLKTNENVSVSVEGNQISVTDTDDNNDVWSSKALFEIGKEIVPGREYKISFDLNGDNGVGEFFLCKSGNLDNRYDETFTSEDGNRSVTFTATSKELYVGMQVGNIGKGNSVSARIFDICEREKSENPALLSTANCSVNTENGYITATDTSDNNDVWNSKLLYRKLGKCLRIRVFPAEEPDFRQRR